MKLEDNFSNNKDYFVFPQPTKNLYFVITLQ